MDVKSGATAFSYPNATTLKADQSTMSSAVNFTTFNTSPNASVIIAQPTGGRALYRVDNPVQFYGRLSANGQVFLSSPTGVYFAPGANIDVGGLVATTLSMKQSDFEAGRNIWSNVGATGKVINDGSISAPNGYVALLGPQVANNGVIAARMGTVALAAGDKITLDMSATD
jgi:filamentous hemagglutinin family protein